MVRPSPFRKFTTAFGSTCISSWFYSKNYRLLFSCISYVPWLFSCLFLFLSYGITEWFVSQSILSFSLSVSPLELFCFPHSSYWSDFLIPDFFTQPACFSTSSHWSIFPIPDFFTQPACFPHSSHWSNSPIPDFFTQLACFSTSSHWSIFPFLNFFTQLACFPHSSHWSIFPILDFFTQLAPQMRKFPNSSKILHKRFVLTNFLRYNNHGN